MIEPIDHGSRIAALMTEASGIYSCFLQADAGIEIRTECDQTERLTYASMRQDTKSTSAEQQRLF